MHYGYVYARTYREVKEKLLQAKYLQDTVPVAARKSLNSYCDEWLILSRSRIKESTYVKYHNIIQKHIRPELGQFPPQSLNTVLIENFSHNLLKKGLCPKTVHDILVVLSSILNYCRKELGSAVSSLEIIYPKESPKEMRILTKEEQSRFIQYLLTGMYQSKFGVLLALLTGMRIGEVCALRWEDISLPEKMIHVSSTMQRLQILEEELSCSPENTVLTSSSSRTKVVVSSTKSRTSDRFIPLTDYATSLCARMVSTNPKAYILTGQADQYMEPRALQYRFKKYVQDCDMDGVHFHTLRHTFATRCVEVDFEIKSLSEILGHSGVKVTLDRYVHSSMELKRKNMEKLTMISL